MKNKCLSCANWDWETTFLKNEEEIARSNEWPEEVVCGIYGDGASSAEGCGRFAEERAVDHWWRVIDIDKRIKERSAQ